MSKGIIVVDDIPENCFKCKMKRRPYGITFPEDRVCVITGESVYYYKPNNINGTKPDWCPIKPIPDKMQSEGISIYAIAWNECLDEIIKKSGV